MTDDRASELNGAHRRPKEEYSSKHHTHKSTPHQTAPYCAGGEEQYCENGFVETCNHLPLADWPGTYLTNAITPRLSAFDTPDLEARNVRLLENKER